MTSLSMRRNGSAATSRSDTPSLPRDGASTLTSPSASSEWAIGDRVVRLRQVGTDRLYMLQAPKTDDTTLDGPLDEGYLLGSLDTCSLRISDPKGRVSKRHARVYYSQGHWHVLDLGSKNGFTVDGVRQLSARLSPGMVLGVGGVQLIAESARSIDLRCYLARVMGWGWNGDPADQAVERALQTVRAAHMRREALWLQGGEDAMQAAQDLHRVLFGRHGSFVVCDPRRKVEKGTVRVPGNQADLRDAVKAARGGTVCVRSTRLPAGFAEMLEVLRASEDRPAHLLVCDDDALRERPGFSGHALAIPPVSERPRKERENVVREYFFDAMATLGVSSLPRPEDRAWVLEHSASSLQDIAKGTLRILALRLHGSFKAAALELDMAVPSLERWIRRRHIPPWLAAEVQGSEGLADTLEGESAE